MSFILAGSLLALSGVMLLPVKCHRKVKKNKRDVK